MYVQVVNFELQGVSHSDYEASCEALAPAFAEIPGLLSNVWMVEPESNLAGGAWAATTSHRTCAHPRSAAATGKGARRGGSSRNARA
jgi:hypothetical protein